MTSDFSSENIKTRKKKAFNVVRKMNCQPMILQPVKISIGNEAERKSFSVKGKPGEFTTNTPILEELLNKVFHSKRNITRSKLEKSGIKISNRNSKYLSKYSGLFFY